MDKKGLIESGKVSLGIELGSTRIKAVLIDFEGEVLAVGFHDWENSFVNGVWTYSLEEVHKGLKSCYNSHRLAVKEKYACELKKLASL